MNAMTIIKGLPLWVRHTPFCPLRAAGLPPDYIPNNARDYFRACFAWAEVIMPHLKRAYKLAQREAKIRKEFKDLYEAAPLQLKEQFPASTYQDHQARLAFIKAYTNLTTITPPGFGSQNAQATYHAQRGLFKVNRKRAATQPILTPKEVQRR